MTTPNDVSDKNEANKPNGRKPASNPSGKRTLTSPNDVAALVMMQLDAVGTKKDELTIAIKSLTDTAKQLVRAYAGHAAMIQKLQQRVKQLEGKGEEK